MNRRSFLGAVAGTASAGALVALAGCVGSEDGIGELTVIVTNEEEEVTHTVAVTVTNQAGDVVESLTGEDIEPGVGRTFTSAGYPDNTYQVAVEDDREGLPAWKQTTQWSNLTECPSLVFELRLTNQNGIRNVVPSKRCESP
jgi:Uma2 family endonuclease